MIELPSELKLVSVEVSKVSKSRTKHLRKCFRKSDKRLFFAVAISEICSLNQIPKHYKPPDLKVLQELSKYEIHHIVPLSLGGSNSFDNLALVEPELHKKIHKIIEAQGKVKSKTLPQKMEIPFPKKLGLKVWGLNTSYHLP